MALPFSCMVTSVAAETTLFAHVRSFNFSEPVSVKSAFNDLDGRFKAGRQAFTHSEAEIGAQRGKWRLSWFARYDYDLSFHPDTAELIYLDSNNLPVELDRRYQLQLEARRARSRGIRVGYEHQWSDRLAVTAAVGLLRADTLQEGNLSGDITTLNNGTYSGDVVVDYVYDEDRLLDRPVSSPTGDGVTFDVAVDWQVSDEWRFNTQVRDLFSRIRWRNAPYTQATVTSSTISLDANGFIETQPVLSGVEGYRTHYQTLPIRSHSWLEWHDGGASHWGAGLYQHDELVFPRLRVRSSFVSVDWHLFWDAKSNALGAGVANQMLALSVVTDSANINKAHTLGLALAVTIPLN